MKKDKTPRCRRCGRTVRKCNYKSDAGYKYSCEYCDEDLFSFEVYFEDEKENTK